MQENIDLESLSDDQLAEIAFGKKAPDRPDGPNIDLESLSEDDLAKIAFGEGEQEQGLDSGTQTEAFIEGLGKEATLGYLPQLQAVVGKLIPDPSAKINKKLREQGFDLPDEETYAQLRDQYIKRSQWLEQKAPGSFTVGRVTGAISSSPIYSAAFKGANMATKINTWQRRLATGINTGAIIGFLSNPGDTEGVVDPGQISQRIENGVKGAALGGLFQGGLEIVGSTFRGFANLPKNLRKLSDLQSMKSAGAFPREMESAVGKNKLSDIADTLFDNNIIEFGDTVETISKKAAIARESFGQKIFNLVDEAERLIRKANPKSLSPEKKSLLQNTRFDGESLYNRLMFAAKKALKNDAQRATATSSVRRALLPLKDMGDDIGLNDIQAYRRTIDRMVNYNQEFFDNPPAKQQLIKARNFLQDLFEKRLKVVDGIFGSNYSKDFRPLNKTFSNLATVDKIASRSLAKENARQFLGLKDVIAGAGAASVGGPIVGPVVGVSTALASKELRKYASPAVASLARKAAIKLSENPSGLGKYSQILFDAATKSSQEFVITIENLLRDPDFKRTLQ